MSIIADLKNDLSRAQDLVDKNAKFPRVSLETIKKRIKQVKYYQHEHLVICVVEMENGYFVVGKAAPADVRNFQLEVGQTFAREDAIKQIWQLEGYLLRDRIYEHEKTNK